MKKFIVSSLLLIISSNAFAGWTQQINVTEVWVSTTSYVVGRLVSDSNVRFKCKVNGDTDLQKSTIATALTSKTSSAPARFSIYSWDGGCQMNGIIIE